MTAFETMLLGAIGTGLTGAGGLIAYIIKSVVPRVLAAFEERNKALLKATEKTAEAVVKIPEAIKSFELALVTTEGRIGDKIEDIGGRVISRIEDRRYETLAEAVRNSREPPPPR